MICYRWQHYATTKFMICYWAEHCMLRPSLWFVTGQNTVYYDQVYDLLLVRTLYVTTKFMICYWSERCMLRPSLRFVSGQNTVCYDQVYDLLLVRTLCYDQVYDLLLFRTPYVTISNSYILIDCCVHIVFDQVYDLLLVRTLYVTTKFTICYWSEHCMLRPSLWFVAGQNVVCYDQVYDLLLVRTLYATTKLMIISPLSEGGGGYTVLPPSVRPRYFSSFFSH
jgi:hypothetical protein